MTSGRADRTANPSGADAPEPRPAFFFGAIRRPVSHQVSVLPDGLVHERGLWSDGREIPGTIYDPRTGRTAPFDPAKHSPEPDPPTGGD